MVEQPAGKGLRFRYECEGRSAGSIPGTVQYSTVQFTVGRAKQIRSLSREVCYLGVCTFKSLNFL